MLASKHLQTIAQGVQLESARVADAEAEEEADDSGGESSDEDLDGSNGSAGTVGQKRAAPS